MTILLCEDLACGYADGPVVRGLTMSIESGEILALLGPNGAGKTTSMLTIAGLLPRLGGEIRVSGKPLPDARATVANHAGVVLIPDDRSLFMTLTVRENLQAARRERGQVIDDALELFPALHKRLTVKAGNLSGGEQQMLALARGLMQKPRVLLIDEMSMGLAPTIVEGLLETMKGLASDLGTAIVLVEQHIHLALEVADNAIVLVHGEVVLKGTALELRTRPELVERAYLATQWQVGDESFNGSSVPTC